MPGAEGATAPETLRQKDRIQRQTLERGALEVPAEGVTGAVRAPGNLSGRRTEGA